MLVIQALSVHAQDYWRPGKYPIEMCYLGRFNKTLVPAALEVWFDATSETLPDGISGHHTVLGRIKSQDTIQACKDATAGRKTQALLLEDVDYSLVRGWIEDCTNHHGTKYNPPSFDSSKSLSLLLVDAKRIRLVECGWYCYYLVLSYVWGVSEQFQTVRNNVQELSQDRALLRIRGQLLLLIRDAIDFVAAIGESYLWIDSLCIFQDDTELKEKYIPKMDSIYRQALLTLIIISGHDVNSALPGVTDGSRRVSQLPVRLGSLILVAEFLTLATVEKLSMW
jgi:hypothetical protein